MTRRWILERLAALVRKVEVTMTNDDGDFQTAQVLDVEDDDPIDGVECYQPYGFSSRVSGRAMGLLLAIGGARTHSVLTALMNPHVRLRGLKNGEVAIYDDLGNIIHLRRERLQVDAVTELYAAAPSIKLVGVVDIQGTFKINGVEMGLTHKHALGTGTDGNTGGVMT